MTPLEKLVWMQEHAVHVEISINEHRVYYETVKDSLETRDHDLFEPEDAAIAAECVRREQLVIARCYPVTPIGFYRVGHYDLSAAIDRLYAAVEKELRTTSAKNSDE